MNQPDSYKNNTMNLTQIKLLRLLRPAFCVLALINTSLILAAEPLVIAVAKSPLSLPIYVAQAQGYFDREDVKVKTVEVMGGHRAMQQILNGEADLATASEAVVMFTSLKRNDFMVIGSFASSRNDIKMIVRKEANVTKPQQLAGKRIATVVGAASHYYLDTWLLFNDVDPQSVKLVNLQPEQMQAALSKGEVDAVAIWEPYPYHIIKALPDAKMMENTGTYVLTFNLIAHKKLMGRADADLAKLLRALVRAERFIKEEPSKAQAILRSSLQHDQGYVDWIWPHNVYQLSLDQSLLSTLESEARWARQQGHVSENKVVNYLDLLFLEPMLKVAPKAVGIKK